MDLGGELWLVSQSQCKVVNCKAAAQQPVHPSPNKDSFGSGQYEKEKFRGIPLLNTCCQCDTVAPFLRLLPRLGKDSKDFKKRVKDQKFSTKKSLGMGRV